MMEVGQPTGVIISIADCTAVLREEVEVEVVMLVVMAVVVEVVDAFVNSKRLIGVVAVQPIVAAIYQSADIGVLKPLSFISVSAATVTPPWRLPCSSPTRCRPRFRSGTSSRTRLLLVRLQIQSANVGKLLF